MYFSVQTIPSIYVRKYETIAQQINFGSEEMNLSVFELESRKQTNVNGQIADSSQKYVHLLNEAQAITAGDYLNAQRIQSLSLFQGKKSLAKVERTSYEWLFLA